MRAATLKRRLFELERVDAVDGTLPCIVEDDTPDVVIEQMRRQGHDVMRLRDFVERCT